MKPPVKYCAVYTRKSSEEGLEQDFNSLDAQKEACLAYIASQKIEGWVPVKGPYDDGGFSGGNTTRPGLQKLLTDIRAGKVNIIVVYKIDRLTRSLMDFAKLVETFDQHGVTFVSVTQSFNTTTSMGRLTLNVLLSFAQFEREVTGERIRDKIGASKKKGMWMGGNVPFGYDAKDRQLVVNEFEAKTVRHIFERYRALGSVPRLKADLEANDIKCRTIPFSRGSLYALLSNPVYIGKTRHKDQVYDGQHKAIIAQDMWDSIYKKLADQSVNPKGAGRNMTFRMLQGRLFDCEGTLYSPTFTNKRGKRYRYYISQNLVQWRNHPKGVIARLPAHDIETLVESILRDHLGSPLKISALLNVDQESHHATVAHIAGHHVQVNTEEIIRKAVAKITVDIETLELSINVAALRILLSEKLKLYIPAAESDEVFLINVPYRSAKSYRGAVVIRPEHKVGRAGDFLDLPAPQLKNLVRGVIWRDEHFGGLTIREIAEREHISEGYVGKLIFESFEVLRT